MSIFQWVAGLFSKLERLIKQLQPKTAKALAISTNLRAFLASPTADLITSIIPTQWDDLAKQEAIKALDYAIPLLQAENKCGIDVICWAKEIATWPAPLQNSTTMKLASLLLGYYDEFKQAEHMYDSVIQTSISGVK